MCLGQRHRALYHAEVRRRASCRQAEPLAPPALSRTVWQTFVRRLKLVFSSSYIVDPSRSHLPCVGSHSATCHPTLVKTPRFNPSQAGRNLVHFPGELESWLVLVGWLYTERFYLRQLLFAECLGPRTDIGYCYYKQRCRREPSYAASVQLPTILGSDSKLGWTVIRASLQWALEPSDALEPACQRVILHF